MADSKITALTSIGTATDPAVDPLVLVDVSDTSMAATGTTKKVTLNNLLASSPTAANAFTVSGLLTAASATITGDLTVDTSTLKVDSANNRVGVLTASPRTGFALDVLGRVAIGSSATTGSTALVIDSSGTAGNVASIQFRSNNVVKAYFGLSGSLAGDATTDALIGTDASGAVIRFYTSDTGIEAGRINSTGVYVLKGGNISANGVGIAFPATQAASSDANTLDDYEEGTFTATLKGTVSDPTNPVTATARYTKIGRVVTVTIQFSSVTTTGASGRIQIDGLPFANNSSLAGTGAVGFNGMATFTGSPFASLTASSSTIAMFASNSAGAYTAVTFNAGTTQDLWTSLTYTV